MIIKEYEYNKSIEEFILNEQAKYEQKKDGFSIRIC